MAEKGDIIDGHKGGLDILIGGYKLNWGKVNKNGTILWRCRETGYRASLTTTSDGTVVMRSKNLHISTFATILPLHTTSILISLSTHVCFICNFQLCRA